MKEAVIISKRIVVGCSMLTALLASACAEPSDEGAWGEADDPRIIDGELSEAWPAVVGVQSPVGLCSGTQIAKHVILTAAHCVTDLETLESASAGDVSIYWGNDLLTGLSGAEDPSFIGRRGAKEVAVHPSYLDPSNPEPRDIAIIVLDGPGFAEPIPIRTEDEPLASGEAVTLVGFGTFDVLDDGGGGVPQYDGLKREGRAELIDLVSVFPDAAGFGLEDLLYTVDGRETLANGCFGDSGGPLLAQTEDGYEVIGVASFVDSSFCDGFTFYDRIDTLEEFVTPFVRLSPVLECVEEKDDGSYVAHFGYFNPNGWALDVSVGGDNRFSPGPKDRGQPELFEPGRHVDVFEVPFVSGNQVWKLGRRTATASPGSKRCK